LSAEKLFFGSGKLPKFLTRVGAAEIA